MKVLFATGMEELDKELLSLLPQQGITPAGTCHSRQVLADVVKESQANTVVVSPQLKNGENNLVQLIANLSKRGIRMIVLPGHPQMVKTQEFIIQLVPYGIYDYCYDPIDISNIIERLKTPATLNDVPKSLVDAAMSNQKIGAEIKAEIDRQMPVNGQETGGILDKILKSFKTSITKSKDGVNEEEKIPAPEHQKLVEKSQEPSDGGLLEDTLVFTGAEGKGLSCNDAGSARVEEAPETLWVAYATTLTDDKLTVCEEENDAPAEPLHDDAFWAVQEAEAEASKSEPGEVEIDQSRQELTPVLQPEPNFSNENKTTDSPIGIMCNGKITCYQSLDDVSPVLAMNNFDAVFMRSEMTGIIKAIKKLRRCVKCPIVVIGICEAALIKAGADECYSSLNTEVVKIVSAKAEKVKELWEKANIDERTSCYKQNFMNDCFTNALQTFNDKGELFSVIYFDLNDFKQINDTYGHNVGDEVLKAFGNHLRNNCRKFDVPVRCGGDEFILLLPKTSHEEAVEINKRIKESWTNNFEFHVHFSTGVSQVGKDGVTQADIIEAADKKMYQDKRQSKQSTSIANSIQNQQRTNIEVRQPMKRTNILALVVNANEERLAAFSIYTANAVANNGMTATLVDCYYDKPLIGPMLKLSKTKDWRKRGINATALINEMKVLPLSQNVGKDDNHLIEDKFKDLIKELQMIDKEGLIILNFGKGSPLLDVVKDDAVVVNFKIDSNNYQYQLPQMAVWDNIPGEPDYARDSAIMEMVNKLFRGVNLD